MTFASLDEVRAAAGTVVSHSEWLEIDQKRVDMFAEATGDLQWIHTDPARAAQGPFGTTIAHGYLTLSLVPFFLGQLLEVTGISMAVNYGLGKVRFPAAVPVGSSLQASAEVVDVDPQVGSARLTLRVSIGCDLVDRPVCVADVVILFVG